MVRLVVRGEKKPLRYFLSTGQMMHELRICDIEYILSAPNAEQQGGRLQSVANEVAFLSSIGYMPREVVAR